MARHSKNKGGRGGRGGSRGGGHGSRRGGRGGSQGGKKNSGQHRGQPNNRPGGEFPELFDLNDPGESSMRATAKRTRGRRAYGMQNEAFQTEENKDTVYSPCRKRPVEFVLATLYDPTKDLIVRLANKDKEPTADVTQGSSQQEESISEEVRAEIIADIDMVNEDEDEDEAEAEANAEVKSEGLTHVVIEAEEIIVEFEEAMIESQTSPEDQVLEEPESDSMSSIPDDQLFFVDDEGEEPLDIPTVIVDNSKAPRVRAGRNTDYEPVLTIGHVHLPTTQNKRGQSEAYLPSVGNRNKNLKSFNPAGEEDDHDELYDVGSSQGRGMYQSYNNYISRVLQNMNDMNDDDDSEEFDNFDEEDQFEAEEEANFLAEVEEELEEFKENTGYYKEDKSKTPSTRGSVNQARTSLKKLDITGTPEPKEPEGPEFGFLPEDYETFDTSLVDIINIRFGVNSNQYFLKSYRLLGDNDYQWIDQEIFTEFLLENGLPEHRLNAYLTFIQNQVAPPEPEIPEISNFDQIPFSDSESEDEYDERNYPLSEDDDYQEIDTDENEGLDDLINFTKKYDGLRDMDVEPTQTLKTRGKGRKKELDLDHIEDMELRQSLADQYQIRRNSKKNSKSKRESNIEKEHEKSQDLLLKYPFSFHIKDIRNEYESFLHDSKRNALTFPPMDVHAIKTLGKFAHYYNMKHRKFGKGHKMHAVIVKNKRTFHSLPDYHSIGELMKQRRVFNRTDQKRPRTEVEQEEAKNSRRGKPSKAFLKTGDVVGADAPEIAGDNVGRKLLMKMGWSSGQGLGLDNRGVPEPVVAIVKNNKAGLR